MKLNRLENGWKRQLIDDMRAAITLLKEIDKTTYRLNEKMRLQKMILLTDDLFSNTSNVPGKEMNEVCMSVNKISCLKSRVT